MALKHPIKALCLIALLSCFSGFGSADQETAKSLFSSTKPSLLNEVTLAASYQKRSESNTQTTIEVTVTVTLKNAGHIYSTTEQKGVIPTVIVAENKKLEPMAGTKESLPQKIYDATLLNTILAHKNSFELKREFTLPADMVSQTLPFSLRFQICNGTICSLPVSKPFTAVFVR